MGCAFSRSICCSSAIAPTANSACNTNVLLDGKLLLLFLLANSEQLLADVRRNLANFENPSQQKELVHSTERSSVTKLSEPSGFDEPSPGHVRPAWVGRGANTKTNRWGGFPTPPQPPPNAPACTGNTQSSGERRSGYDIFPHKDIHSSPFRAKKLLRGRDSRA